MHKQNICTRLVSLFVGWLLCFEQFSSNGIVENRQESLRIDCLKYLLNWVHGIYMFMLRHFAFRYSLVHCSGVAM